MWHENKHKHYFSFEELVFLNFFVINFERERKKVELSLINICLQNAYFSISILKCAHYPLKEMNLKNGT